MLGARGSPLEVPPSTASGAAARAAPAKKTPTTSSISFECCRKSRLVLFKTRSLALLPTELELKQQQFAQTKRGARAPARDRGISQSEDAGPPCQSLANVSHAASIGGLSVIGIAGSLPFSDPLTAVSFPQALAELQPVAESIIRTFYSTRAIRLELGIPRQHPR